MAPNPTALKELEAAMEAYMKGNPEVIGFLNEALAGEIIAGNQYFFHAKLCESWGYAKLGAHTRSESLEEMRHAEVLMSRILYLEGEPVIRGTDKISIGRTIRDQLHNDLALEVEAVKRLNRGIELCARQGDAGTRILLQDILRDEEEHVSWLEVQMRMIEEVGLQAYLAQQIAPAA